MSRYADLPVARKIQVIIVAIVGAFVLAASLAHAVYTSYDLYRAMERHAHGIAQLIANNSSAALAFGDTQAAAELLETLRSETDVEGAIIVDRGGISLATFCHEERDTAGLQAIARPVTSPQVHSNWRRIIISEPVLDRSAQFVGTTVIVFKLDRLYFNLTTHVLGTLLIVGLAILLAWPLARRVARTISAPIEELNAAMTAVSASSNFGTRVDKRSNDEIGSLFERFNSMLGELEQRDRRLEEHRDQLETQVVDRTRALEDVNGKLRQVIADLETAKDKADAASDAKSRFMATMSHEIRSPLHGVIGMVELMRQTELSPRQQHFCATIASSSKALLAILNDILDFSKIEAGRMQTECIEFAVDDLLQDTVQLFTEDARRKSLELICDNRLTGPVIAKGDPYRLRQVLTNLLSNALKFTEQGNVVVRVSEVARRVDGARLRLEVTDTGIGMTPDVLLHIFDSFVQADGSTSRRFGGTGLGLAISRELIQLMGGELRVDSEAGRGSRFWFELELPILQTRRSERGFGLADKHVLVVDDNEELVSMLVQRLHAWQMSVEIAHTTDEFIGVFYRQGRPIDLILLDEEIRDNVALALLDHTEAAGLVPAAPIILLSSHASLDELETSDNNHGIVRVVGKPIRQSDLFDAMAAVLSGYVSRGAERTVLQPQEALFMGRTVMLAEDNPVNQEVAEELLASLGLAVTIAGDGAAAIEAYTQLRPDVVFMDCQMPGVDGYRATRAIRDLEDATAAARTPIIALTANALDGDRERCLASGMDDFLSKPFQLEDLVAVLRRWLAVSTTVAATETPKTPERDAVAVLDAASIEQLRSIEARKAGFLERIAASFTQEAEEIAATFRRMKSPINPETWDRIAFIAHRSKSAAATIGAIELAGVLGEVESAAHARDEDTMGERLRFAVEMLPAVRQALADIVPVIAQPNASATIAPSDTATGSLLLAEDDEATALVMCEALSAAGYTVRHVSRGDDAIAAIERDLPDVVLLDVLMPGMDGFGVLSWMRRQERYRDLPVIVMTGLHDTSSIHGAYQAGATDFIVKPVAMEVLTNRLRYIQRAVATGRALRQNERRLRRAQQAARLSYWEWNERTQRLFLGENIRMLLGLSKDVTEIGLQQLAPHVGDGIMADMIHKLSVGEPLESVAEFAFEVGPGETLRVLQHVETFQDLYDGSRRVMGTVQDVTTLRDSQQHVRRLSHFDALTGLPNESFLRRSLALLLNIGARNNSKTALLLIDPGEHQRIASVLGEQHRDQYLVEISTRLEQHTRASDLFEVLSDTDAELSAGSSTVAAVPGHRFVVVLTNIEDGRDVAVVAERIIEIVSAPVSLGEHEVYPKVCIGVAVAPDDSRNADELQQHALAALSTQAQRGPGYLWYSERVDATVRDRLRLERSLRQAIENEEIEPYFQPRIDARTLQPVSVEALARWRRGDELVSPAQFIPIAEETGLIKPLGELILRKALAVVADWHTRGLSKIALSVNVSGRQFKETDVPRICEVALRRASLSSSYLELELTEGVLVESSDEMLVYLRALSALGVRLALDDFGTGFSSLAYLNRFPINVLKIDRSFVAQLLERDSNQAIVRATIGLGHELGMEIVAEGVETEDQANWLTRHHCDQLQGYFFSKPLPKEAFEDWLLEYAPPNSLVASARLPMTGGADGQPQPPGL